MPGHNGLLKVVARLGPPGWRSRKKGRGQGIPPCIGFARIHAELGHDEHDPRWRPIDELEEHVATLDPERGATLDEERDVRTELRCEAVHGRGVELEAPELREGSQRRRGIAASSTQSRLYWNPLVNLHRHPL